MKHDHTDTALSGGNISETAHIVKTSQMWHIFDAFITIQTIQQLFPPARPYL